jgi:SAM-dependent methyltransferase
MSNPSPYFMDDPREGPRLASKVEAGAWVDKYLSPYLEGVTQVLDVGCGPGVLAAEVARRCPHAHVRGLDLSPTRLAEAKQLGKGQSNLQFQQGDAAALPFDDASLDLIYCRFLLEYLPDKHQAVAEMARVCAPGGHVILQDLDGQLLWHYPVDEQLQSDIEKAVHVLAPTGFDPLVGRKLFSLARDVGLADIQVRVEPYHLYAGRIDDPDFHLWELKLAIALPAIAAALGGEAWARDLKERFLAYLRRDDTLTYSTIFTVLGTVTK